MPNGRLIVVATPIGNLSDLSPRAAEALAQADAWIVEDTRQSGKLASHLGIKKSMLVLNDHTRQVQIERYLDRLAVGETLALITDGGTPVISDPGTELVDLAHTSGFEVDGCPGPSAAIHALAMSGFYGQRFAFLGFLPRKRGDIAKVFAPFAASALTLVLFESPHRIGATVTTAFEVLGPRRAAICREMTKLHQQIIRGTLDSPADLLDFEAKGEITIVIEGIRKIEGRVS